ncbi:tryptophan synthase subunit alpha [Roseateles sp. BYS180W]|uniref:Tryptophan synthase alpha chain n=1 Tax=Roseateles rivi TaxID=3299028 RepID=A0ABW7FY46_9BURK
MSRIAHCFAQLSASGRKALIPYITAGDPYLDATTELMLAMADAGADVIELGVPFSDPMADGPVIQRASERALARGMNLSLVLEQVKQFRQRNTHTPVVLMGYANPVECYGVAAFARDAQACGVDGVLIVDYPPEECEGFASLLRDHEMDPIFLLAPTSSDARIQQAARLGSGYVYYVSLKGVTGAAHLDTDAVAQAVPRIKAHVSVPVGVGFGIRDGATAAAVARHADAVVIGSALVQRLESQTRDNVAQEAAAFIRDVRAALDA